MPYVYVIRSLKSGKKYVGSTSRTPEERLREHNAGIDPWTNRHRPVELIYFESIKNMDLARKREKYFKTGKGRKVLELLLTNKF